MLATDGELPAGPAWAFEFVWDGLRAVAYLSRDRCRLLSGGSDRSITAGYPELAALSSIAQERGDLVLDGTIVVHDLMGRPSRAPLRQRMSTPRPSQRLQRDVPVLFYLGDVLFADGRSTLSLPYQRRRELLAELDLSGLPARLPPYFLDTDGPTVLGIAQQHGLAGVLAKRLDSRYQPGRRSRAWVQTLHRQVQRVVIGGWQPSGRGGDPFGSLLLGVPEPTGLRYVGRVSAGLDQRARRELSGRLDELASTQCPFREPPPERHTRAVRWVQPGLVGEVEFRQWEADGRLRAPTWLGLRRDAHPASVRGPLMVPGEHRVADDPDGKLASLDEAVRVAQSEVRALRAQISPHFVYNVLTTIAAFVRTDPPRARELLAEFAEYTRYSFRAGNRPTTVGAELTNTERYLALERARFGERLRVVRHVARECHDVRLPFLTLQPLVESAVRNGIEGTPRGGTVRISAAFDGQDCVLSVSERDTDVTDPAAGLPWLSGLDADSEWLAGPIADVRERLDDGELPGTLEVHADPEFGSTVTIRVSR